MASSPVSLAAIRLVVLDVDGVLTDGRLYYGADGEALKVFHVHDGHGIKKLIAAGIAVAVISGRNSPEVAARCRELGIEKVQQGCEDKARAFRVLCEQMHIDSRATLCVVDDTTDLGLVSATGFAVAVADAHPSVREAVHRVTQLPGGKGAVREVCDWLLAAHGASK